MCMIPNGSEQENYPRTLRKSNLTLCNSSRTGTYDIVRYDHTVQGFLRQTPSFNLPNSANLISCSTITKPKNSNSMIQNIHFQKKYDLPRAENSEDFWLLEVKLILPFPGQRWKFPGSSVPALWACPHQGRSNSSPPPLRLRSPETHPTDLGCPSMTW